MPRALVVIVFAAAACARTPPRGWDGGSPLARGSIEVGGRTRTFVFHAPAARGPRPLVIALHGRLGTGEGQAKLSSLPRAAEQYGFVAVFPDGIDHSWADARGATPAAKAGVDDVAFVSALIDRFVADHDVDPRRVYVTGFSNGAIMTQTLGCALADKLAAIAPVSGYLPTPLVASCHPAKPLSVLIVGGDDDGFVPYGGGEVKGGGFVASAADSATRWRELDGCTGEVTPTPMPDLDPNDGTTAVLEATSACAGGSEVSLITIHGGGHTWPSGMAYAGEWLIGKTSRDVDATAQIWRFFAAHAR